MKKWGALFGLVFLLFLLCTTLAFADALARLRLIGASNAGSSIDPSLRDVHEQLGTLFSFTSYRLLRDQRLNLSLNRPVDIAVHPGRSIEVTLIGQRKGVGEFRIRIIREGKDMLNTQVRLSPGRTILIGGPKHGEGVIILALSASFAIASHD